MSEEERLARRYELRNIIIFIPIKVVISLLIVANFTILSTGLPQFLEHICDFIVTYSLLSIIVYISQAVGNWLFGFILFFVISLGASFLHIPDTIANIIGFFLSIGGFSLDVYRIVQFIRLSGRRKQPAAESTVTVNDVVTVPDDKQ